MGDVCKRPAYHSFLRRSLYFGCFAAVGSLPPGKAWKTAEPFPYPSLEPQLKKIPSGKGTESWRLALWNLGESRGRLQNHFLRTRSVISKNKSDSILNLFLLL